jgi:hypothetical protein
MRDVWVNPETGGVESTVEWRQRFSAGDPEAHRQLAELARPVMAPVLSDLEAWGLIRRLGNGPDDLIEVTERGLLAWRFLTPFVERIVERVVDDGSHG